MGHSALAFVIVIGILVFIHEFGHFIVARLCGVGVQVFSLGFGPKVLKKTWGRTEYCLSAVPLGGYVKMVGEEPGAKIAPEDEAFSFTHKSLLKKSLIVAAGPVANFFLAIFFFYLLYQFSGIYLTSPLIGDVLENMPAGEAGLRKGDIVRQIDDQEVESFEDIARIIGSSKGEKLQVVVERGGRFIGFELIPVQRTGQNDFQEQIEKYVIGISGTDQLIHKTFSPPMALWHSVKVTGNIIRLTILSVGKMITGSISAKHLGGPLMIAQMAGEQAKAGVIDFLSFIALLSVNLGIINLFPIPVLDGGHLLFFAIEAVTRKKVSDQMREKLIKFGAALLVALMVFVFYNDIIRMFNGG